MAVSIPPPVGVGKATWFFQDEGFADGWSETLYSGIADLTQLLNLAKEYAKKRWPLLGHGQLIKYIRVSTEGLRNDTQVFYRGLTMKQLRADTELKSSNDPDTPWQTILLRFSGGANQRKMMFFRGVPDRIEINPPGPKVIDDAEYLVLWNRWTKEVVDGQWGWLARNPGLLNAFGITNMGIAGGDLTITTGLPNTLAAGDPIQFLGGIMTPKLTGVWSVKSITSNTTFIVAYPSGGITNITSYPRVKKIVLARITVDSIQIAGETSRKVGRPFGSRRGRLKRAR